jgi:DNA-binding GntR family transcriptional regulator
MKEDSQRPKEALYQSLRRNILTLRLAPGSDIDETTLAAEFNLSRPPLREVLRQMAGEGYLKLRVNRGAQVSAMNHNTLRDFFLVAPMVYSAVTRLAARNATEAQIDELKQVQRNFRQSLLDGVVEDRIYANDRFHALTGEMADNVYLTPSLRRLLIDHARIAATFYRPRNEDMKQNLRKAADQHDEMIACIEAGDEDGAAAVATAHWELSRGMIALFVTPEGLDTPLGDHPKMRRKERCE